MRPSRLLPLGIAALAALYVVFVLRVPSTWWFEDDPYVWAFAGGQPHPGVFFWDRSVIQSPVIEARLGHNFTPVMLASIWLDQTIAPASPRFAYAHTVVSFAVAAGLLVTELAALLPTGFAVLTTLAWMLLPSTIVVAHFLSTRQYMEGFVFLLAMVLAARRGERAAGRTRWGWTLLAVLFFLLAGLSKEIHLVVGAGCLAIIWLRARDWKAVGVLGGACVAYTTYRGWAVGLGMTYVGTPQSIGELGRYFATVPFLFSAGAEGYALIALFGLAWGAVLYRDRRQVWCLLALSGIVVGAILPVIPASMAVVFESAQPGTWYRIMFLVNAAVLLWGMWAIQLLPWPRLRVLGAALVVSCLLLGGWRARGHWDELKLRYETEGRFYLQNPGRLVFSDVPAYWFLEGIDQLYGVRPSHYVTGQMPPAQIQAALDGYGEIWRYREGSFVKDPPG